LDRTNNQSGTQYQDYISKVSTFFRTTHGPGVPELHFLRMERKWNGAEADGIKQG
jgi:hypothetical protein